MKKCLSCKSLFSIDTRSCPSCGWQPDMRDEIPVFSPDLVQSEVGFKESHFEDLYAHEDGNFWFRARNKLLAWAMEKFGGSRKSILEIGCGTGYVLTSIVKSNPTSRVFGSEIFTEGLKYASRRLPEVSFFQMDARNIPFAEEFDLIGAFDVLEHINEDDLVLSQLYMALKQGGQLFITVPQHQWLWSPVDEYACHVRRYSKVEIHSKIEAAGFKIIKTTSFVFTLLPLMYLSRVASRFSKKNSKNLGAELKISPVLNYIFEKILDVEVGLISLGFSFPVGGSRFIVARKK